MAEDKTLPPSATKLRKAREKGQVPKSREFVSGAVTIAATSYLFLRADTTFAHFTQLIQFTGDLVAQPPAAARADLIPQLFAAASEILTPLFAMVIITAAMTTIVATGGLVLSLSPLAPNLQKLNPVEGLKHLFSIRNLLDVFKNATKFVIIAFIATDSIRGALAPLVEMPTCGLSCAAPVLSAALRALLGATAIVIVSFALLDLGIERWLYMRDQRMDHAEAKNEHKETEGNPEIRLAHALERREAAHARVGFHEATFVIAGGNFAVAMRYSKIDTKVPMPVARAEAENVSRLLAEARRRGLPIVADASTARLLFETATLGQRIARELYEPVIRCMHSVSIL
jgi:type III secretion protein U